MTSNRMIAKVSKCRACAFLRFLLGLFVTAKPWKAATLGLFSLIRFFRSVHFLALLTTIYFVFKSIYVIQNSNWLASRILICTN